MLFETFSRFPDATGETEELSLWTILNEMLVELLSAHFALVVAIVGTQMHFEGGTLFLEMRQVSIISVSFKLALFELISFNLVRNFLLFHCIFFSFWNLNFFLPFCHPFIFFGSFGNFFNFYVCRFIFGRFLDNFTLFKQYFLISWSLFKFLKCGKFLVIFIILGFNTSMLKFQFFNCHLL